ncbi:MAG TPA: lipid-A-disaccharide synthase [Terracidiphilus sp.]|jgi:lipid-A-disaccharide synthase|nr:lipid-A-disaccharide synthase [Terracidiphilus sp.]
MPHTLFISAGEASGEHYGALLVAALRRRLDAAGLHASFFGMGGERMEAAGLERVVRAEDMAVMGLTEVVRHLPRIYGEFRKLKRAIRARRPDVAVLIDFPEIHFRLAREFHRLGVPVIYFVSPQLWAWKKRRIQLVRQYVRRMLVIFPFEEPFYRERGVDAEFVGHPLAELPPPAVSRAQFAAENGLDPSRTWIALLPGSRPREIADHLPEMLRAARLLAESSLAKPSPAKSHPADGFQFVVPLAPTLNAAQRAAAARLAQEHGHGLAVRLVDDARAALLHARAAVVASGTATVEAALIGNPFVVVYRVSPATYAIARRVVTVPHVAMANLIAGRRVVPELIQHDFTAANIVQHLAALLPDGTPRQSMVEGLKSIRDALSRRPEAVETVQAGAIERVAVVTMEELRQAAASAVQS